MSCGQLSKKIRDSLTLKGWKEVDTMNKILIIDDDILIASTMEEFLKSEGYSVQTSTDPISSFWLYSKYQPDLVLCDINMPVMDGMEVLKRIRKFNPLQKFIMVTGAFLNHSEFNILKEQNVPQIIKPPDMEEELLKIIKKQFKWEN